jgi:NitT/TauT family transport system substrate-binding protein
MRLSRFTLALAVLAAAALTVPLAVLAGPKRSAATHVTTVKILNNWFAEAEQGGYWQAAAQNLAASKGFKIVSLQGGPGIQTLPQVIAGKADFGVADSDQILAAQAQGLPVVAVFAPLVNSPQCLIFRADSGIKTVKDLDGKEISVVPGAGPWPWVKAHYHLTNAKEVAFNGQLAQLKHDKNWVQQCFITEEPLFAKQQNIPAKTMLFSSVGYNMYQNLLFTTESMIKNHPDEVAAVVAAVKQGWITYVKSPSAGNALIESTNHDMPKALLNYSWKALRTTHLVDLAHMGQMTNARWLRQYNQVREAGLVKKAFDSHAAFTTQFLK